MVGHDKKGVAIVLNSSIIVSFLPCFIPLSMQLLSLLFLFLVFILVQMILHTTCIIHTIIHAHQLILKINGVIISVCHLLHIPRPTYHTISPSFNSG